MRKKQETQAPVISTIRFSGKEQLRLVKEVKELAEDCGVVYSDLLRNLIAIGLEAYRHGAIVGFDGKVVLSLSQQPIPAQATATLVQTEIAEVNNESHEAVDKKGSNKKKSLFVE